MKRIHLKPQDPCWCGSGRPYGECHQALDQKIAYYKKRGHIVPSHSLIRTPAEIAGIQDQRRDQYRGAGCRCGGDS